jgi:hypothetical protein
MVAHNGQYAISRVVETYARSMVRDLRDKGHQVIETQKTPPKAAAVYNEVDFLLDIDCGRDDDGKLHWHGEAIKPRVKSAVYFIDTHGYPSLHHRLAKNYDHVFFCVWDKRDRFSTHPSAHWCPNFTDLMWFDGTKYTPQSYDFNFGFFGSKGGLERANPLIEIANNRNWKAVSRQVARGGKHRWPETAMEMSKCQFLFNHGQKHDGPNLRVMESMAMKRPLITDQDPRSGMDKLFEPGIHYIPYEAYTYKHLEQRMQWCMDNPDKAKLIAQHAYDEVTQNHLVGNRIDQILEVVSG